MKNSALIILIIVIAGGFFGWQFLNKKNMEINCLRSGNLWSSGVCTEKNIDESVPDPLSEEVLVPEVVDLANEYSEKTAAYEIVVNNISDFDNSPIKEQIHSQVKSLVDEFKGYANDAIQEPESSFFPWSFEVSFNTYASKSVTTVFIRVYEYTGGAHPNSSVYAYHYRNADGSLLTINDVVKNYDTLNVLAALAEKSLQVDFPEGLSPDNLENWNIWYIDNGRINFIFQPYQIAAYAMGEQEFSVVATGDNAGLFNQEYFQ